MIMSGREQLTGDGAQLWLDPARRYRLELNAHGELLDLRVDGETCAVCPIGTDGAIPPGLPGLAVTPPSLSLQEIIHICQSTGHPVLLAEDGKILGVCGQAEIIRALSGSRRRAVAA
jgi:glycine betaine/proline transport system ATP-binding protein